MMYGYPVLGPLSLVRSTWFQNHVPTKQSVLQYMLNIRERVAKCCELATRQHRTLVLLQRLGMTKTHMLGILTKGT